MARMKLMARKHVCALPHRNAMPTKSHTDGQNAGYFPRTLQTMLLALGSSEPLLFIRTLRLLHGNSYLWCVHVVVYERPTTDRVRYIHQVVKAPELRWTFEAGMREAAYEVLSVLWHEADERMTHSQYCHFSSWVEEGAKAVVLPIGDDDRMGCFTDQVNLTRAVVWDLDEAIKEVKFLGEHEEESSQKIMELETMWKKLTEDAQRLEEEKVTLEGMIESHDELLMEIAKETRLDCMGEDVEDEEEDEDADDGGDAAAPPAIAPPPPAPLYYRTWGDRWWRPSGDDPWARSPSATWSHLGRRWAWDVAASSLPCTRDGWLGWSRWRPKWRSLRHGRVISWKWE
jgi:hypothetical protein